MTSNADYQTQHIPLRIVDAEQLRELTHALLGRTRLDPQDAGHQLIAYDIAFWDEPTAFFSRMAELVAMVRGSRTRPGFDEIVLPGELEWRRMQHKLRDGVPLDAAIFAELRALASELDVRWPFPEPTDQARAALNQTQRGA